MCLLKAFKLLNAFFELFSTPGWKDELSRLPHQSYFGNIENPIAIRFFDFVQTCATSTFHKREIHLSWTTEILLQLTKSKSQVLRNTGAKLTRSWIVDKEAEDVTRFWRDMAEKEAREGHVHNVHVDVYHQQTAVSKALTKDIIAEHEVPSTSASATPLNLSSLNVTRAGK